MIPLALCFNCLDLPEEVWTPFLTSFALMDQNPFLFATHLKYGWDDITKSVFPFSYYLFAVIEMTIESQVSLKK